ncbi:MAG TPA: MBL fold metallo-hydrolase [Candidatus Saccharimonadales bacterium]|jgi:glyoxylase-like metal-dependent hydrolase (beta-lactamase superfamily II)|nr:MBL fold metallo-hydrolase [Candidatus Saccharimonadales bacterium]
MAKRLWISFALFFLCAGAASAQDAKTVLQDAQKAMGNVTSIQYAGTGHLNFFGQAWTPDSAWPPTNLTSYSKTIDYSSKSAKENIVHSEPTPMAKGGGRPFAGDDKQANFVSGQYAWDMPGSNPVPQNGAAAERQLQIWLTPHGFLKGAMENNATAKKVAGGTEISFQTGKFTVTGRIDAHDMVTKTETHLPNPVLGDMLVENTFSGYKDFNGVKFPTMFVQKQGGSTVLELNVSSVNANPGLNISVPDSVKSATPPAIKVDSKKLADGIWFVAGGSHNSMVVEFPTYITVIEGPLGEARSLAVIAEAKKLVPNKPIKYLINTHSHFDHSGGVRTYVAEGATIITQEINVPFYQKAWAAPRTLAPDNMAKGNKEANFIPVKEKYELTEGNRTLEIFHENGSMHNGGMLIVYFPKEKILEEADDYTPDLPDVPAPSGNRPAVFIANLVKQVQALKLNVETVAPMHGIVEPYSEVQKAAASGKG